jgi:glycosyltransferase involved in cell wall biosynthesis
MRLAIREKYGIPREAVVFTYGGNLGKPQGVGFIEEVLQSNQDRPDYFFLIVGSGTEYGRIKQAITERGIQNAKIIPYLPKVDYDQLLAASDVGLIFLDPRFTIPNFPSRLLGYMEQGKPVLAATDENTDLGRVVTGGDFGLWCKSGDLLAFNECLDYLAGNVALREKMGRNSRKYLLEHYTVDKACDTILGHFEQEQVKDYV